MGDFLDKLAKDAKETLREGYYDVTDKPITSRLSLKEAVSKCAANPVIAEVKAASPSAGPIRTKFEVVRIVEAFARGGAVGISVLTEPKNFKGSLSSIAETRMATRLPILMKDLIISPRQLETAQKTGADAVLLIQALFTRDHCQCGLEEMIEMAHKKNLEVLLEIHNKQEFQSATRSSADLVGINNRNLGTLDVNLNVTRSILETNESKGKIIVSESGIKTSDDIRFLRECGVNAFLVGTAIMESNNVETKVRELVTVP